MKLGTKLLIAFLLVGIIPFAVIGTMSLVKSEKSLSNQAFSNLESVRDIKKTQLEQYFKEKRNDMSVLLKTVKSLKQDAFEKLECVQSLKKNQIEQFFKIITADVTTLSTSQDILIVG